MSHRVSSFEWLYSRTHQGNGNGAVPVSFSVISKWCCTAGVLDQRRAHFLRILQHLKVSEVFSHWGYHWIGWGNECGVKRHFPQKCQSHRLSFPPGRSLQISDKQATLRFPGTHKCPLSRRQVAPSLQTIPADLLLPCRHTLPLEMNWYPHSMSLKGDTENCEAGDVNSHLHFKVTGLIVNSSWTIKKAKHRRIAAFELWCWRRLLRVPWTARRSNQSILKEISPGCSLQGLTLKLKLH